MPLYGIPPFCFWSGRNLVEIVRRDSIPSPSAASFGAPGEMRNEVLELDTETVRKSPPWGDCESSLLSQRLISLWLSFFSRDSFGTLASEKEE